MNVLTFQVQSLYKMSKYAYSRLTVFYHNENNIYTKYLLICCEIHVCQNECLALYASSL